MSDISYSSEVATELTNAITAARVAYSLLNLFRHGDSCIISSAGYRDFFEKITVAPQKSYAPADAAISLVGTETERIADIAKTYDAVDQEIARQISS